MPDRWCFADPEILFRYASCESIVLDRGNNPNAFTVSQSLSCCTAYLMHGLMTAFKMARLNIAEKMRYACTMIVLRRLAFSKRTRVIPSAAEDNFTRLIKRACSGGPLMLRNPVANPSGKNTTVTYVNKLILCDPRKLISSLRPVSCLGKELRKSLSWVFSFWTSATCRSV